MCDDKSGSRNFIAELVNKFFQEKEQEYSVKLYESPMDLLLDLDLGKYFDLYLLDVENAGYKWDSIGQRDPEILF